jgi:DivIVA domain-containing protein
MTWFFAILVVVVMGGVAVVATGAGGSMAETFDDRPDARVPADRPLGAADLRRVRFGTAFRGYRMSEVDALLDRLAVELEPPVRDRRTDLPSDPPATDRPAADRPAADRPVPERSDRDA